MYKTATGRLAASPSPLPHVTMLSTQYHVLTRLVSRPHSFEKHLKKLQIAVETSEWPLIPSSSSSSLHLHCYAMTGR